MKSSEAGLREGGLPPSRERYTFFEGELAQTLIEQGELKQDARSAMRAKWREEYDAHKSP